MSTNKFQYWPSNGQLGSTKFTMPTNAEDWPSGDALVGNFVYSEGKLVDFIDTKALVVNDSKTSTFPYDYVNVKFDSIKEGDMTFVAGERTKHLIISYGSEETDNSGDTIVLGTKYLGCKTLEEVQAVDSDYLTNDIVNGVWTQSLADLESCETYYGGYRMFYNCKNLTSFTSDLSNLIYGCFMFEGCNNLTSFNADLSNLLYGFGMFNNCNLDTASIENIANTIHDFYGISVVDIEDQPNMYQAISIGIKNSTPNDQENAAFYKMVEKGWVLYVNGYFYYPTQPANLVTLDENGEETVTPIPFYAKPVQTDEKHAKYTDSEGNFFNILGGQFIYGDDLSTYGIFTCEADAAAQMRLTKIEK